MRRKHSGLLESPPLVQRLLGAAAGMRLLVGGRLKTPGAIVFAYHDVGLDGPNSRPDYFVPAPLFRRQLEAAIGWGVRFVDLSELADRFLAGDPLDGLGAIAFDDGFVGVHHHAMPILLDLGLPATVFTVTDRLGESPPWWPGTARIMTRAEATEMSGLGFQFQSHSRTHASLLEVSERELTSEVAGSKASLEDLVGAAVTQFAYPYGHHNSQTIDHVEEAGYRAAYSFLNGRIVPGMSPFALPRLCMIADQRRPRLAYHLARRASSWPETQLPEVGPVKPPRTTEPNP